MSRESVYRSLVDVPPRPVAATCSPQLVRIYDPAILESCCTGFETKAESALLRVDFRDVFRFVGEEEWYKIAPMFGSLSAVHALSCWMMYLSSETWFTVMCSCDAFRDRTRFLEVAEIMTVRAKRGAEDVLFAENESMVGYRLAGIDDVSVDEEVRKVMETGWDIEPWMQRLYKNVGYRLRINGGEAKSLQDYIADLDWSTQGGAALYGDGKVEVNTADGVKKLRVTKNRIPSVLTLNEVMAGTVRNAGLALCVARWKDETQKRRLFYNGAFFTILRSAYVLDSFGNPNYDTSTLELDGREEKYWMLHRLGLAGYITDSRYYTIRSLFPRVLQSACSFALSVDWKKFDQQVRLWELVEFWEAHKRATTNAEVRAQIDVLILEVKHCYILTGDIIEGDTADYREVLRRNNSIRRLFGLISGMPETSKMGLRKNSIVMEIARLSVKCIYGYDVILRKEARGDDSEALFNHNATLDSVLDYFLVMSAFGLLNAKKSLLFAAPVKFEFLRLLYGKVSTDNKLVRGYLGRTIVNVVEKKPITSEQPTRLLSVLLGMLDHIFIAERRGAAPRLREFGLSAVYAALDRRGIRRSFLHAPRSTGGLGYLEPAAAVFSYNVEVEMTVSVTDWEVDIAKRALGKYEAVAHDYALLRKTRELSQVDEPWIRDIMRSTKVEFVRHIPIPTVKLVTEVDVDKLLAGSWFGSDRDMANRYSKAIDIGRILNKPLRELDFNFELLFRVEHRFKLPRRLAVDWLSGEVSGNTTECHPSLASDVARLAAASYVSMRHKSSGTAPIILAALHFAASSYIQAKWNFIYSY